MFARSQTDIVWLLQAYEKFLTIKRYYYIREREILIKCQAHNATTSTGVELTATERSTASTRLVRVEGRPSYW